MSAPQLEVQGGLTLRWSRLAPAWHLARLLEWSIIRPAGQAPSRRSRLSSNVRQHTKRRHVRVAAEEDKLSAAYVLTSRMKEESYMTRRVLLVLLSAASISACTSQQLYSAGQEWQRTECRRLPIGEQERCFKSTAMTYEQYRREAAAARSGS